MCLPGLRAEVVSAAAWGAGRSSCSRQVAAAMVAAAVRAALGEGRMGMDIAGADGQEELDRRLDVFRPFLARQIEAGMEGKTAYFAGEHRARRNVAVHSGLGLGAAAFAEAARRPQRAQRAGKRKQEAQAAVSVPSPASCGAALPVAAAAMVDDVVDQDSCQVKAILSPLLPSNPEVEEDTSSDGQDGSEELFDWREFELYFGAEAPNPKPVLMGWEEPGQPQVEVPAGATGVPDDGLREASPEQEVDEKEHGQLRRAWMPTWRCPTLIATMFLLVGFFSIAKQVWKINEESGSGYRYSLPEFTLDQNPTEAVSPDLLDNQTVYQGERLGVIDVIEYEAVEDDEEEAADEGEDEGEDFISEEEEEISIDKFQGLDHDGNGFLSAAELRHVVNQDDATDELVEKVFRYVDADGEGQIDPDEFVEVDAWDRRGGEN